MVGTEAISDRGPLKRTPAPDNPGTVHIQTSDVTAWCPYEGTADYYDIEITYQPDEWAVELMSLRDYFQTFRDEEIGHEEFAEKVWEDVIQPLNPSSAELMVDSPPRYGFDHVVTYEMDGS